MKWYEIQIELEKGKKAKRGSIEFNDGYFLTFDKDFFPEKHPLGAFIMLKETEDTRGRYLFRPATVDLLADDWEVIEYKYPEVDWVFKCPHCNNYQKYWLESGLSDSNIKKCVNCDSFIVIHVKEVKEEQSDVLTKYREWLEYMVREAKVSVKRCNSEKINIYKEMKDVYEGCLFMLNEFERESQK